MTFKRADYYFVGGIVAALWLLALARADHSQSTEYRPIDRRREVARLDDCRELLARLDDCRKVKPDCKEAAAETQETIRVADAEPVVHTQKIFHPPAPTHSQRIGHAQRAAHTQRLRQPSQYPLMTEVESPVAHVAPPNPDHFAEDRIARKDFTQEDFAEEDFAQQSLKMQYPPEHWQSDHFGETNLDNQAHTKNQVKHADSSSMKSNQSVVPEPSMKEASSDLADLPNLVPGKPIDPPAAKVSTKAPVSIATSQADDFSIPSGPRRMTNRFFPASNSQTNSQTNSNSQINSNSLTNSEPKLDSGSDSNFVSDFSSDFEFELDSEPALQLEPEPAPEMEPTPRLKQPELDPDLAANAKMVRKVNWEQIEPDSELAALRSQPSNFPGLVRRASHPEIEARAFGATKQGKALATRGAYFAAKEEFLNALMMVAESNDRSFGSRSYTTSLLAGFKALKESEDFATTPQRREHSRDLHLVLASHETKVIDPSQLDQLSFNRASEIYCQFGQARIEQAIGESKAASSALFHLSRLHSTAPELRGDKSVSGDNSKRAMLLASLTAYPDNFEAANELGVLFYDEAWYKPAAHWFSEAVRASGGKKLFWQNLAECHNRLASTAQSADERAHHLQLAQLTSREAGTATQLQSSNASLAGWVSQEQFRNNSAIPEPSFQQQAPVPTAQVQVVQPVSQRPRLQDRIKGWFQ